MVCAVCLSMLLLFEHTNTYSNLFQQNWQNIQNKSVSEQFHIPRENVFYAPSLITFTPLMLTLEMSPDFVTSRRPV